MRSRERDYGMVLEPRTAYLKLLQCIDKGQKKRGLLKPIDSLLKMSVMFEIMTISIYCYIIDK